MKSMSLSTVIASLVLTMTWPLIVRAEATRNVLVRIVSVEDVADDNQDRLIAVRVFIGTRRLYQTPFSQARRPFWGRSLRAFTAGNNPLVFEVVATNNAGASKNTRGDDSMGKKRRLEGAPSSPAKQDEALAYGFEELVGDYEDSLSVQENESTSTTGATQRSGDGSETTGREEIMCRVRLEWPPPDKTHRLKCGWMTLVVETRRIEVKP